jgi:chromosome partitioning protein
MRILATGIHKGGVGKSTTVFNLGHELARSGRLVLMVDLDYQASLTHMAGCPDSPSHNIAQVMTGALPLRNVVQDLRPGLAIVPSDIELADVEISLIARIGRENILRRALATIAGGYDVCLLDCPPSLFVMTVNGLTAANGVLIPLQPTQTDLRALDLFLATIGNVRKETNAGLELLGVVLTFFDQRYGLHTAVTKALHDAGLTIVGTIGRSVKIAEATGANMPLSEYDAGNPQAQSYKQLAEAVDEWLDTNPQ